MNLNDINKIADSTNSTGRMPVLFLGHGNPMNAIDTNEFTVGWSNSVKNLPYPVAVLCISAHWETAGTRVTAMEMPKTIHDFGGFPEELYSVVYPAPGKPELAHEIQDLITATRIVLDEKWGLDHGCWSVIKHMYPKADIPVVQLSLDYYGNPRYHYNLAKDLASLRDKGILIVGSGNIVHNLMRVAWNRLDEKFAFDWAAEANEKIKTCALSGDHEALINYRSQGKAMELAVPTPDHFLPLLYVLALKHEDEKITVFNDKPVAGSLTMTCFKIEQA